VKVLRVSFKKKSESVEGDRGQEMAGVAVKQNGGAAERVWWTGGGGHLLSSNPGLISAILLSYEGIQI